MTTIQRRLELILTYLAQTVNEGKYGNDDDIDEEIFWEDFEELSDDINAAFIK